MLKMITVRKAREEIKNLQEFVELAELYEAETLEKLIIKEYAFTNSIVEITRILNRRGILKYGKIIENNDVLDVIKSKPTDELHKLVQSWYKKKTKHIRSPLR